MASTARKPRPQQPEQPVFELCPGIVPNVKNGAKIYKWWTDALSWPSAVVRRKLADLTKNTKNTNPWAASNYFAQSLTTIFKTREVPIPTTFPLAEVIRIMARDLAAYVRQNFSGKLKPEPAIIWPLETTQPEPDMAAIADRAFVQDGVRYFPLPVVAELVQAPNATVHNWVKRGTDFDGKPLETLYFAPTDSHFMSEESVQRAANRFVKWPSREPAGAVIIGPTKDESGYLGTADAARILGVSSRTPWLWAKQGKAATEKQLDVIQCKSSGYFYIRERDVYDLRKQLPKTGLKRGRRPRALTPG